MNKMKQRASVVAPKCLCGGCITDVDFGDSRARSLIDKGVHPDVWKCYLCGSMIHAKCGERFFAGQELSKREELEQMRKQQNYLCPVCRVRYLDQFYPVRDSKQTENNGPAFFLDLIDENKMIGGKPNVVEVEFQLDGNTVREQLDDTEGKHPTEIVLRCVRCDEWDFGGTFWPMEVRVYLNGSEVRNSANGRSALISAPHYGHVRKEPGFLKLPSEKLNTDGTNNVKVRMKLYNSERLEDGEAPRCFVLACFAVTKLDMEDLKLKVMSLMRRETRNRQEERRMWQERRKKRRAEKRNAVLATGAGTAAVSKNNTKKKSTAAANDINNQDELQTSAIVEEDEDSEHDPGDVRYRARRFFEKKRDIEGVDLDELQITGESADFDGKSTSLLCPITMETIECPVVSKLCEHRHLQTFDLDNFLESQLQMQNMAKRWQCPICTRRCRLFDLRFCDYTKDILTAARKRAMEKKVSQLLLKEQSKRQKVF